MDMQNTKVWNFTLPPFPRPAIASTIMSPDCPVNRLLQMEAGKLAALNQLDIIENREDLQKFQKDLRKKIWKKLGTVYDGKLPLKTRYFGTCPQEGFTIRKLMYQSQEGIFVTALLYIPAGEGPFPAVLLMHGHNAEGKFAANNQYMAASLARNGIVCLSVDARGTYERATVCREAEYHGSTLGASIFNTGETLMGQQVVDNMRGWICCVPLISLSKTASVPPALPAAAIRLCGFRPWMNASVPPCPSSVSDPFNLMLPESTVSARSCLTV